MYVVNSLLKQSFFITSGFCIFIYLYNVNIRHCILAHPNETLVTQLDTYILIYMYIYVSCTYANIYKVQYIYLNISISTFMYVHMYIFIYIYLLI